MTPNGNGSELEALRAQGLTVTEIAARLGVSRATVYRRLKTSQADEDEAGPVQQAIERFIAGRQLDADGQVVAAEAVALARTADRLARATSAAAATALTNVSRRLAECRDLLEKQPADEITKLQDRLARRRGAHVRRSRQKSVRSEGNPSARARPRAKPMQNRSEEA